MKYNVLLLGSGGREHALAWKLAQSPLMGEFYALPGNPGIAALATCLDGSCTDFTLVSRMVEEKRIDLVICGPEDPLAQGLKDHLAGREVLFVGPDKAGAALESSKEAAKAFMTRHGIPTAAYRSFSAAQKTDALQFLAQLKAPYVIKADGLAAGKGVVIAATMEEAEAALTEIFAGKFGSAGERVVIEEYLDGVEVSFFVLTDGHGGYLLLPEAKDYKRIWDGDRGLNTGGMGSVSPVPFCDGEFVTKVRERIILPTVRGLMDENIDYRGFIFFGLMNCSGDPYVIEYNVRMGDPETESVMLRIESDLLAHVVAAAGGDLSGEKLVQSPKAAMTCIVVSGGYPEKYAKGYEIQGLDSVKGLIIYHAGTAVKDSRTVTSGGRVLAVATTADTLAQAREKIYAGIDSITFKDSFHRTDIGLDMINWK